LIQRNTMFAKVLRLVTSAMPVASSRRGQCRRCGRCCRLPVKCPFLRAHDGDASRCGIYLIRPSSCRKYPRTPREHLTRKTCGFRFE